MEAAKAGSQPLQQYYVGTTEDAKLATLVDLLRALEASAPLGVVVACGARDSLDEVCVAAMSADSTRVWCLHADLSEAEMESTVQRFKAACAGRLSQGEGSPGEAAGPGGAPPGGREAEREGSGDEGEAAPQPPLIEVLACTEVCLKALPRTSLPLNPVLLINYDLPTKKESYLRRITAVLGGRAGAGGPRVAVNFAVAGRLAEYRAVEEFAERPIQQMPVHVADVLGGAAGD